MRFIKCLLVISILAVGQLHAQEKPLSADAILKEAYATAAKEKKNVMILFHASWCGWCHKMDTSMNDPKVKNFFTDNYVIRHLVVLELPAKKDLENPGAADLLKKYKAEKLGIPYWLVFDKKGKLLFDSKLKDEAGGTGAGAIIGCPASEKEVAAFIKILKGSSKLTDDQLAIIAARFRENEIH